VEVGVLLNVQRSKSSKMRKARTGKGAICQHADPSNLLKKRLMVLGGLLAKTSGHWLEASGGVSLLLPSWMREMAKKESKRAADKKRRRQSTDADTNQETECWKAQFLKAEGKKEMLRVKLEIVEDLMSDHTCENCS
jgi:hypothetical protein